MLIRALLPLLEDSDFIGIVEPAVRVLEQVEIPKTFEKEVLKLLESHYPAVRALALSKMGSYASKDNVKRLIDCLNASDYRIRESAKRSLERMPEAVKPLLTMFDALQESDQLDPILSILKAQRHTIKKNQVLGFFALAQKLFLKKDERFKRYLLLVRLLDAEFLHDQIMTQYKRLKAKRRWLEAVDCLGWLEGSMFLNEGLRYEMSVCLILASQKDLSATARDHDKGLLVLQALVRSNRQEILKRILKEKSLGAEERYYIGFHFMERPQELRDFGMAVLRTLILSKKGGKFAKLAKARLSGMV